MMRRASRLGPRAARRSASSAASSKAGQPGRWTPRSLPMTRRNRRRLPALEPLEPRLALSGAGGAVQHQTPDTTPSPAEIDARAAANDAGRVRLATFQQGVRDGDAAPLRFDFGTDTSPVAPGSVGVSLQRYDRLLGYGWFVPGNSPVPVTHVHAVDRGGGDQLT